MNVTLRVCRAILSFILKVLTLWLLLLVSNTGNAAPLAALEAAILVIAVTQAIHLGVEGTVRLGGRACQHVLRVDEPGGLGR